MEAAATCHKEQLLTFTHFIELLSHVCNSLSLTISFVFLFFFPFLSGINYFLFVESSSLLLITFSVFVLYFLFPFRLAISYVYYFLLLQNTLTLRLRYRRGLLPLFDRQQRQVYETFKEQTGIKKEKNTNGKIQKEIVDFSFFYC